MSEETLINELEDLVWEKIFTSKYSFLNCSIFGKHYFDSCEAVMGVGFSKIIFVYKKGYATLYRLKEEVDRFAESMANKLKDLSFVIKFSEEINQFINQCELFFKASDEQLLSISFFKNFLKAYEKILPYYIGIFWGSTNLDPSSESFKKIRIIKKKSRTFLRSC